MSYLDELINRCSDAGVLLIVDGQELGTRLLPGAPIPYALFREVAAHTVQLRTWLTWKRAHPHSYAPKVEDDPMDRSKWKRASFTMVNGIEHHDPLPTANRVRNTYTVPRGEFEVHTVSRNGWQHDVYTMAPE